MGGAAGPDGGNVPALQQAVRPKGATLRNWRHDAYGCVRLQIAISGLRLVARGGDESESILDCLDARFRPQRTGFHF